MANHNPQRRNVAPPEEDQSSWRPQDPGSAGEPGRDRDAGDERDARDERSWRDRGAGEERDARRWESDEDSDPPERSFDRHGAADRGRGAGRYGEERLRELQRRPRREDRMPSAGSFEDRYRELGPDAGGGSWPDHTGGDPWRHASPGGYRGRDFGPERRELSGTYDPRMGDAGPGRGPRRSGDERIGDPAGSYGRPGAWGAEDAPRRGAATEAHVHRGTGPHRGKGPAGYQRSDERIRELVCESLTDDDQIDASDIEVAVSRGEVTLTGTVDDRRTKRAAEDCACSVSGVRDVHNLLRVRDDRSSARSNPSGEVAVGTRET